MKALLAVPPGVVTIMLAVPVPAGLVQSILLVVTEQLADVPPKVTVPLLKFVPKMETGVPPALEPEPGLILLMVGGETKVKRLALVPVATGVVTEMVTAPALCAGVLQVIRVADATVQPMAVEPPKLTNVAPVRSVPVIVTLVPPLVDPLDGETPVIAGGLPTEAGAAMVLATWTEPKMVRALVEVMAKLGIGISGKSRLYCEVIVTTIRIVPVPLLICVHWLEVMAEQVLMGVVPGPLSNFMSTSLAL